MVLLLLAAGEIALRFPEVRRVLPPRTHYYHPAITTRLDAVEQLVSEHGRVDVLFIGSSIVMTNVNPHLFADLVTDGPRSMVSFNAGLPGLWPEGVHLYAEHLWLPVARPRLVVQGIRYPELAATTHAKNETQVWSGNIEPSWRDHDLITQLYAKAVSNVYLLQYRGAAVRLLERYRDGWATPDDSADDAYATHGYQELQPVKTRPEEWEPDLPNDGVCGRSGCEVGFAALKRTIAAARRAGTGYVLMNIPEHSIRWRGPGGVERYRQYIDQLRMFAEAERVAFVDPTDGDPFRFEQMPYADLAHMTGDGSRQFTRVLAGQMAPLISATPMGRRGRELHASEKPSAIVGTALTTTP